MDKPLIEFVKNWIWTILVILLGTGIIVVVIINMLSHVDPGIPFDFPDDPRYWEYPPEEQYAP